MCILYVRVVQNFV
ncbi:unnamed protein product [Acanthoscelides obtectus]|uniref:Uncharacterized protein n=1 Tax=Acanthoscelides obtectus TaxID=200917 RepID=A0A9P0NV94_ACAOB|nr:unnamed protein product [Acanthoscelides obtectus]